MGGEFGKSGVALMLTADRNNDAAGAAAALRQIETADQGVRSAGQERWWAYFSEQLAKAKVIRDRLKGR
jgi:hypothetical protein